MISFEDFVPGGEGPIYVQMVRFIKRRAAAGMLADGEELPSRRVVSALLGINPNTVQRAYRLLEEEGLVSSHSGAKSRLQLSQERLEALRAELTEETCRSLVRSLKQSGMSRRSAIELFEVLWDREEKI